MKKILALILALCLLGSVLPMAVMADAPAEVTVKLRNIAKADDITVNLKAGDVFYATSNDEKAIVKHEGAEAPADKFIKLEYVSGVVKTTLKNFVIDVPCTDQARHAIEFTAGDYAVEMELLGDNVINHSDSSAIFYKNSGGLTIFGAGNLSMSFGSAEDHAVVAGAIWGFGGDLVLKSNFNVFIDSEKNTLHHAFLLNTGNIIFDGAKVTAKLDGGQVVFLGMPNPRLAQQVRYRNDLDTDTSRTITIKNSEITASGALSAFRSAAPAKISNSILKLSKVGSASGDASAIFVPVPTFEGDYTALGGLASKPQNAKEFNPKKISSYTYIEVLNYVKETEPTTEPTEPTTPEETTPETLPPVVITPPASKPAGDNTPDVTQPGVTTPDATTPNESKPAGNNTNNDKNNKPGKQEEAKNGDNGPSVLSIVMITMICVAVVSGVTVGVTYFIINKKETKQ